MNGLNRSTPELGWWIVTLAVAAVPAFAATPLPPPAIHFCAANCFTLVLRDEQYVREDGTNETWTIERFLPDDVVLHRHDPPMPWNGGKTDVVYSGRNVNGRMTDFRVEGQPVPSNWSMVWGDALSTVPGSNTERDAPPPRMSDNARLMHTPLPSSALPRTMAGGAVVNPAVSPAPAGTPMAVSPAAAEPGKEATRIYVLAMGSATNPTEILTYTFDGEQVAPRVELAKEQSAAMAVDARGELYVSHNTLMDYTVAAYHPDGSPDPSFPHFPAIVKDVAVSPAGNVYVLSQTEVMHRASTGVVQAFTRDGHPIGAPILTQLEDPTCLAVAPNGTVYVASGITNAIVSFTATGQRSPIVITDGLSRPLSMAVDGAGKLYVLNQGPQRLTTYTPDGMRSTPNITDLNVNPEGLAVDGAGRIYVIHVRHLAVYSPQGAMIKMIGEVPMKVHHIAVR